jgi:glycosyltransferase involved in cell wall biosynthesis
VTSGWNVEKSLSMLLVARFLGIRTVGHLHGGSFDDEWGKMARFRRINAERVLRNLDMLIVLGSYWQTWTVKRLGLLPERVRVVNNPIDVRFEQEGLGFPLPGGPGVFFLGVVGKRKGVFDILEAAHLLQSSGCTPSIRIAGPEDDPGALERVGLRLRDLALNNVILAGPVYGDDKLKLYRDNGIFLFPSYNENFPLVVLEAAASGRAIVTTRVGALPEFFADGESVVFVEPGNAGQIAAAVQSLIEDGERRLRLGEGARRVFLERLSRAQILEALDETYRRALGRNRMDSVR